MCEAHSCPPDADVDQAAARPTLGEILRQYGPAYRRKYAAPMSPEQLQAMQQLERCRTGVLGHAIEWHSATAAS